MMLILIYLEISLLTALLVGPWLKGVQRLEPSKAVAHTLH